MAATSLKLPDDLKQRLAQLAAKAGQTPHAFMIDALEREAQRGQLQAQFTADADQSEKQTLASGKAHSMNAAFDYLEARIAGKKVRAPQAKSWRASK